MCSICVQCDFNMCRLDAAWVAGAHLNRKKRLRWLRWLRWFEPFQPLCMLSKFTASRGSSTRSMDGLDLEDCGSTPWPKLKPCKFSKQWVQWVQFPMWLATAYILSVDLLDSILRTATGKKKMRWLDEGHFSSLFFALLDCQVEQERLNHGRGCLQHVCYPSTIWTSSGTACSTMLL